MSELPKVITKLTIPQRVMEDSRQLIRPFQEMKHECCLLWYGRVSEVGACVVSLSVRPDQTTNAQWFAISADSMRAVRRQVRDQDLLLLMQVHTHPEEAFFSEWDKQNALNKRAGALNMVLPHYGRGDWLDRNSVCIVEMNEHGKWLPWSRADWMRLEVVTDAGT